ncbi:hypothetical protein [Marmoricola sp. RAF53]|uniref:hypothetical protein n=1 Tax=Marmoricola sp. RAF53 TaxID=3233059 RepID=UPI003F9996AD
MPDSTTPDLTAIGRLPLERSTNERKWDFVRFTLIAGWIVVLAALPFVGERTADWDDLRDLVRSSKVTQVEIDGELLAGETGFTAVNVRWSRGHLRYVTTVGQVRGQEPDECGDEDACYEVDTTLDRAPSAVLTDLQPDLLIRRSGSGSYVDDTILGFSAPMVLALPATILAVGMLAVLIAGPQPWWATRWAWFWLISTPIGTAAFLVMSGPAWLLRPPRHPERRLTGGWAILLSILISFAGSLFSLTFLNIELGP